MNNCVQFYINGAWQKPASTALHDIIDPATEQRIGSISFANAEDVDQAVTAARAAFRTFGRSSRDQRLTLLRAIAAEYDKRLDDLAAAISQEMGAPLGLARNAHAYLGAAHIQTAIDVLSSYVFEDLRGTTMIVREPIGVCGLITPWNWPINQVVAKVIPALAVGCTVVLKPSEYAPLSAAIWAEVCHAAGLPAGVFSLIQGDGPTTGEALVRHPGVDMISFTGSTRAGIAIAQAAAPDVKRVTQELGGKSPNIVLDDADLEAAVKSGVMAVMINSGQTCSAPTRMLVPRVMMAEVKRIAAQVANEIDVGPPPGGAMLGPLVNRAQWEKVQKLIALAISGGASVITGGSGRPDGLDHGFYVRPTIFADVTNQMAIAQQEVFGPVLVIIAYDTDEEAIMIANDTPYGLSANIQSSNLERARELARLVRAGQVILNDAPLDFGAPFGGYKQSGNGREWGDHAFAEYLETKAIVGYG